MQTAEEKIRGILRGGAVATRPELARLAGISPVMAGRIMARLCRSGEAEEAGSAPSGGGRPVMRYRAAADYGTLGLFHAYPDTGENHLLRGQLHIIDMRGRARGRAREGIFAMLHAESLDDWLDTLTRRGRTVLRGLALCLPAGIPESGLAAHLAERYGCRVAELSPALALGMENGREDTLVLHLPRHGVPQGALHRHGHTTPCGPLQLLPVPADWRTLDYSDNTLVEEMVARLVMMLCCAQAPRRVVLYADFWSEKLTSRIRYNISAKLREAPALPRLAFRDLPAAQTAQVLLRGLAVIR